MKFLRAWFVFTNEFIQLPIIIICLVICYAKAGFKRTNEILKEVLKLGHEFIMLEKYHTKSERLSRNGSFFYIFN